MLIEVPIDVWDSARGGAEGAVARVVRGFVRRGHRVRIVCLRAAASAEFGIEVLKIPAPRWPRWRRERSFALSTSRRYASGTADVTLAVRHALSADVYEPHGGPFRVAVRASLDGVEPVWLRRVKFALRLLRPTTRYFLHLDRAVLDSRPIVVALSKMVEDDFRRAYPGVEFDFARVYNGVDLEEFHDRDRMARSRELRERLRADPKDLVALFVAHKFGPKGLADALDGLALAPQTRLVVVGLGRAGPWIRRAARRGVAARVWFAGFQRDTRSFYAGADALLLPTRYDPCALTTLEALACGVPPITTARNGAAELLTPGIDGFVVPCGDAPAIARALSAIALDRAGFQERCRERARSLSLEKHIDELEEVLQRACERRRGAAGAPESRLHARRF